MAVLLRATQKVLRNLSPPSAVESPEDTALGDWYATRVVVDRVPILIVISSRSLLALLMRAKDTRSLPDRLPDLVRVRLRRLGLPSDLIEAECQAMDPVSVAKTADRSVLGILVDFGKLLPHLLPDPWNEGDFIDVEARLGEMPCFAGRRLGESIFPADETKRLLNERWGRRGGSSPSG